MDALFWGLPEASQILEYKIKDGQQNNTKYSLIIPKTPKNHRFEIVHSLKLFILFLGTWKLFISRGVDLELLVP